MKCRNRKLISKDKSMHCKNLRGFPIATYHGMQILCKHITSTETIKYGELHLCLVPDIHSLEKREETLSKIPILSQRISFYPYTIIVI
jgi:hypothetical protein